MSMKGNDDVTNCAEDSDQLQHPTRLIRCLDVYTRAF